VVGPCTTWTFLDANTGRQIDSTDTPDSETSSGSTKQARQAGG
jgi:hypothetical protein